MIKNNPLKIITKTVNGIEKEKIEQGVIIRHLFLPGRFEETADTLEWLKKHADGRAVISLMSQYTPVPFKEDETHLAKREQALSAIENRLVNKTEDGDDTSWLPDFNKIQPFSNALAKPVWHWVTGFVGQDVQP